MLPSNRKFLSLKDLVKVIQMIDSGRSSRVIAADLGVGCSQIQNVAKRKRDILEEYESGNTSAKHVKVNVSYESIDELSYKWFLDATSRQINVSGPLIKEKALKFPSDLGVTDFKASHGWLISFLKRHSIVLKTQSGERGSVNTEVVDNWKDKIPTISNGYNPCDIFNIDETELFYRDTTKTTYFKKGEDCAGGKRSKERITVRLCASMTGEKLPPLVICKSLHPRCFKSLTPDKLPVRNYVNKKAWMTTKIMEDWLKHVDRLMRKKKPHIFLFLDNAPSHPKLQLTNVKLQFFPPNTTSFCQPMDHGIIQTVKYRKRQLQHVLVEMDKNSVIIGPQILKEISVLQAINWIHRAWCDTEPSTIENCFNKAGFFDRSDSSVSTCDENCIDEDDFPLSVVKLAKELFECEVLDLVNIDNNFKTCYTDLSEWDKNAKDLLENEQCVDDACDDNCDEQSNENDIVPKHITMYNE